VSTLAVLLRWSVVFLLMTAALYWLPILWGWSGIVLGVAVVVFHGYRRATSSGGVLSGTPTAGWKRAVEQSSDWAFRHR